MEGEEHKFESICDSQFVENDGKAAFERPLGETHPLGALLTRISRGD